MRFTVWYRLTSEYKHKIHRFHWNYKISVHPISLPLPPTTRQPSVHVNACTSCVAPRPQSTTTQPLTSPPLKTPPISRRFVPFCLWHYKMFKKRESQHQFTVHHQRNWPSCKAVGTGGSRVQKQRHINQCIDIWLKYVHSSVDIGNHRYNILMHKIVSFEIEVWLKIILFAPPPHPKIVPTALSLMTKLPQNSSTFINQQGWLKVPIHYWNICLSKLMIDSFRCNT